jgi:RNA polymerase sigma-70 factor (sigma-E family)
VAEDQRDAEFCEFARTRDLRLRRVAYLLCGDWHQADDLTQITFTRLYRHWKRIHRMDNLDAYARTTLVNAFLAERRSPWRRVLLLPPAEQEVALPDREAILDLRQALTTLPPRQRATVVLRYYCDLSIEQTAAALDCSVGNVKSQTSRGLDALRRSMAAHRAGPPDHTVTEGAGR